MRFCCEKRCMHTFQSYNTSLSSWPYMVWPFQVAITLGNFSGCYSQPFGRQHIKSLYIPKELVHTTALTAPHFRGCRRWNKSFNLLALFSARGRPVRLRQGQPGAPADLQVHPDPVQRRAVDRGMCHHHLSLPGKVTMARPAVCKLIPWMN